MTEVEQAGPREVEEEKQSQSTSSEPQCCVCYEAANVQKLRCGHLLCTDCCQLLRGTNCPMCRCEIGTELSLLRLRLNSSDGKADFAIPVVVGDDCPDVFSEEHYPTNVGFESVVHPDEFRLIVQRLNCIIRRCNFRPWMWHACEYACWFCGLGFIPFLLALVLSRLLVTLAIYLVNRRWAAEKRGCYLKLTKGLTLERSCLHVKWTLTDNVEAAEYGCATDERVV